MKMNIMNINLIFAGLVIFATKITKKIFGNKELNMTLEKVIVKDSQEEVWGDIQGWEGYYQISNLGRVKSLDREIMVPNSIFPSQYTTRRVEEKILINNEWTNSEGYLVINVTLSKNGEALTFHPYEYLKKNGFNSYKTPAFRYPKKEKVIKIEKEIVPLDEGFWDRVEVR
jgi:hypothetical protein